ncbi:TolC family protein [Arenibacter lacus]|uniref:TolC family protein n=1 Tax=Arenibacter lacus TaxID=2608629 RepID=UPI00123D1657|nr:TolC family protein [Arenibacter lacus]
MTIGTRIFYCILLFLFYNASEAQELLSLNREEAEAIFLEQNLSLMAEKLEIPKAEALVLQAKVWPNPSLSIEEVNLWATQSQREPHGEELPPLFGNKGRYQQFSVGLEQLILTAGKRKKLLALEQVGADKAQQYFEDLLRSLKIEFRHQLTQMQYLQLNLQVYQQQLQALNYLVESYKNQVKQGHIAKGEYIRLKALEMEFNKESNDLKRELHGVEKELKLLMRLPATTQLTITEAGFKPPLHQNGLSPLSQLLKLAASSRPDLKLAQLNQEEYHRLYTYERAKRVPDVTLKAGYDRGGSILYNFIGFGLEIDLPIFDRNKGNIQAAALGREQSQIMLDQKSLAVENEIALAYQNLEDALSFLQGIDPEYETTLEQLLENYNKNFAAKHIGLLEYIDFLDAYLENKKIILEAGKELLLRKEELNYAVGQDIIK